MDFDMRLLGLAGGIALLLVACHTTKPRHATAVQQIQRTIQESIDIDKNLERPHRRHVAGSAHAKIFPPLSRYIHSQDEEPRFDVTANKTPAREFFMGLIVDTPYNMVVHPSITGTITLNLKNVTLKQAMDAVHDTYGYVYHRTSYGYEVLQPQLETQLFHVNYLDVARSGRSFMQLTTGQVSNKVGTVNAGGTSTNTPSSSNNGPDQSNGTISSVETKSIMRFWTDLEENIRTMVGTEKGHRVSINQQAGVILVHAYPAVLRHVARYIESIQHSMNRQVILEAKILEVTLNDNFQAGIDWGLLRNPAAIDPKTGLPRTTAGLGQAANQTFPTTDLTTFNGIFALRINGNFSTLINLLQTQGNVQVLSSPHISTVNNQKAVLKVGSDEFFVTGVSTTNSVVGNNTLPSQDVSLTPFFSGITLDVTPEISRDNTVVLHIHPSVSVVKEQTKVIGLGANANGTANNLTLPLALSTIRESDNIVRAKNGQVIVIGGLMQNNMSETLAETPWAGKLPFLGALFRRTNQSATKSELVILLRPIVASNKNFISSMENDKETFKVLKRPFHAGGLPKVFGNEGEYIDND